MSNGETVIVSACRTPIGSFGGALKDVGAARLGAIVIREALARAVGETGPGTDVSAVGDVGDVVMGCVLQAGLGMNVARQAALEAGLPASVPAETVNRVCGSGLQAVVHGVEAIIAGRSQLVVAGGTESMSGAPYLAQGMRWGLRMGQGQLVDSMLAEGLTCAINDCHMGLTAEAVAEQFGVSRSDQDAFAAESQRRAGQAIADGAFRREITPVEVPQRKGPAVVVEEDEYPRPGTTAAKLAGLRTAFKPEGTVTAGNASGINDGAAALVVASAARAATLPAQSLARVVSYAVTGVDPMLMGIGPVGAVREALGRAGRTLADVDLFELNEAFAAQSVAVVRELGVDPERVNVNGGAIALGHPIGASGARVLTTLLFGMQARGARLGVAALCIGGGMGIAIVVEAV